MLHNNVSNIKLFEQARPDETKLYQTKKIIVFKIYTEVFLTLLFFCQFDNMVKMS